MMKKKTLSSVAGLIIVVALSLASGQGKSLVSSLTNGSSSSYKSYQTSKANGQVSSATSSVPDENLAKSVLTKNVVTQLGSNLQYNNAGAFTVNDNHSGLNASVKSAPYAVNTLDKQGRAWIGNALLNSTTRQYENRSETGNGASSWKPAGFVQVSGLSGSYTHVYDRGHLLGYALVGGIKNFDASESNPRNIATQTAWANEARSQTSTGQNYYEGIVRQALDQHKVVRYRVTDIYDGQNLVPSGAHIQAQSSDGSIDFNVFVPNVQGGVVINYATGQAKIQ